MNNTTNIARETRVKRFIGLTPSWTNPLDICHQRTYHKGFGDTRRKQHLVSRLLWNLSSKQLNFLHGAFFCTDNFRLIEKTKMKPFSKEYDPLPADPEFLFDGPADAARTFVLAQGAGASMDSPFMEFFAKGLGKQNIRAVRFEFPYMASYRKTGKKKPPDREPVLRETWWKVIELVRVPGLVIGGKSMGGRIASLIADDAEVSGLVCLGYPFHPTGQPDRLRVEHLESIKTPTLILQGERDPFGSREEVVEYELSSAVKVVWLEDGDHSFKPRKTSGRTEEMNWQVALYELVKFVESLPIENNQR